MARKMYSVEAEQSVIGAILLQNAVIDSVNSIVEVNDFNGAEHRKIYSAIIELSTSSKKVDVVTLSDILDDKGLLDSCGGIAYIAEIARNTPSAQNAEMYAKIVADYAKSRRFVQALEGAKMRFVESELSAGEFAEEAQREILSSVGDYYSSNHSFSLKDSLKAVVEEIDRKYTAKEELGGVRCGIKSVDDSINGFCAGDLIVLAGRPSMGKSALAIRLAMGISDMNRDGCCMIQTLEMPHEQVTQRLVSAAGMCPLQAVMNPYRFMDSDGNNYWENLSAGVAKLSGLNIEIDQNPDITVSQLRGAARKWRQKYGKINVIVVDYLQLMGGDAKGRDSNRTLEVSEITRGLKKLAMEMGCCIIALSQLNRSLEQRPNKRPIMSDLRESGSIEQDADIVSFVYRDEVYNQNTNAKGITEWIVAKNRNGPLTTVPLVTRHDVMQYFDLRPEDAQRIQQAQQQQSKPMSSMASF